MALVVHLRQPCLTVWTSPKRPGYLLLNLGLLVSGPGGVTIPLGAGQGRPCRGGGDGCGSAWLEGPQTASRIICFKPMWPVNRSWVEHQVLVPHTTHDGSEGLGHEWGGLLW